MMTWYVMSAKRDATRAQRLQRLIVHCAAGQRIVPLKPTKGIDT
jgi:hypothetical protein